MILNWLPSAHVEQVELASNEVTFLSQLVQLLKTFSFNYLGLAIFFFVLILSGQARSPGLKPWQTGCRSCGNRG